METIEDIISNYYNEEEKKKEKNEERLYKIEKELQEMKKQWVDMYDTII